MKLLVQEQGGRNIKPDLSHENSTLVPAFTRKGAMYHGTKADIIPLLMKGIEEPRNPPETSGLVVDGAVIAHQLSPALKMNVSNFRDYIQQIQLPCVETFLANKVRTYWVYDVYNEDKPSTKQAAWAKLVRRLILGKLFMLTIWLRMGFGQLLLGQLTMMW